MARLSLKTLGEAAKTAQVPAYDPTTVKTGILHLGVGAFHRAHQAVFMDDLLAKDPRWGIAGAQVINNTQLRDALAPQDFLYTVGLRSGDEAKLRVVGSLRSLVVPDGSDALIEKMCDPTIRIVSITVTEKGYCYDPATGDLAMNHPGIAADLANPHQPTTLPGFITEALRRRRAAGTAPFTVLSCDNLPSNGITTRKVVTQFAESVDKDLAKFIAAEVAFPGTMVDRIVPATTEQDIAAVSAQLGLEDAWPVVTEPFIQWVIEDHFTNGRPDYESLGAEMVKDVEPYERMKHRMLNGSHSMIAYLGYLAGYETVAETMADRAFEKLIFDFMTEELAPTLHVPGVDLGGYRDALIARFKNTALKHRTWQIAMDGSQKLPQRMLGALRDRLESGESFDRLALGIAAWMRYVTGRDEHEAAIDVRDPLADRLKKIADETGRHAGALTRAYLSVEEVFGHDLGQNPAVASAVEAALTKLLDQGAAATVKTYI
ncbi:mannitol dehydrogenase family protein [Consotaella salsifontis]|uniref:Fructuronate reductase n=1 Tax=Consotaella salsifontis TaxID=1365950 RepID=A0A1T4QS46_9HYPH|nr:mannitol dehydrogenase family protein [Consotaella salsifontis]SKA06525.1 fructuronate reductase [Consotaella salsifontis]